MRHHYSSSFPVSLAEWRQLLCVAVSVAHGPLKRWDNVRHLSLTAEKVTGQCSLSNNRKCAPSNLPSAQLAHWQVWWIRLIRRCVIKNGRFIAFWSPAALRREISASSCTVRNHQRCGCLVALLANWSPTKRWSIITLVHVHQRMTPSYSLKGRHKGSDLRENVCIDTKIQCTYLCALLDILLLYVFIWCRHPDKNILVCPKHWPTTTCCTE